MTLRPGEAKGTMSGLFELQRLLWDLRHDDATRDAFRSSPASVVDRYCIDAPARAAVLDGDVATLLDLGVNPLLVLAAARATGIPRERYYEQVRTPVPAGRMDA